jgi:hypothetical protein
MPIITILFGCILCGLSLFSAFVKAESVAEAFQDLSVTFKPGTWLIPAGFGIALILLGAIGIRGGNTRKHAMHGAAMVGTIGALVCLFRGVSQLFKNQEQEGSMLAVGMVWSMAVVCLTFVGVCVQSFIAARKAREAKA